MENRLMRSQQDRILGGVCGGLGKYLNIDVVLVRLFFIVFTPGWGASDRSCISFSGLWFLLKKP